MKIFRTIVKIVIALATIGGAVYVIATYGEKIVAWCKKVLASCPCCCKGGCDCCDDGECTCEGDCTCCEEDIAEEAPAEEVPVDEAAPVADEADFEG